jgi:hypothetical protein
MKERRSFSMPKAWRFSHDRANFYLKFDEKLAKKYYTKKRRKPKMRVEWW